MGIEYGLSIRSIVFLIILPFSILYIFSLFNLYIGRYTKKYKLIILSLNFILLIGYLILLVTIPEYNQVPLIVLLIILLSIVVLGIIGGFMFNERYSRDNSNNYVKQIKWFLRVVKAVFIFIGIILVSRIIYEVMTHEVKRLVGITYILESDSEGPFCDSHLGYTEEEAEFFLACDDKRMSLEGLTEIKIYFDDELIHESLETNLLVQEGMYYIYDYDFEIIKEKNIDDQVITVSITIDNTITIYTFTIYKEVIDYSDITVPIWTTE